MSIETWPYEAAFLPRGKNIPIVTAPNAGHEPLIFLIPASLPIALRHPAPHRGKHRSLSRVTVSGPLVSALPADVTMVCDPKVLGIRRAPEHQLELEWYGAESGESQDFRPMLPLVLRW